MHFKLLANVNKVVDRISLPVCLKMSKQVKQISDYKDTVLLAKLAIFCLVSVVIMVPSWTYRNKSSNLLNINVNINHHNDVIMTTISPQLTSLMVVYSTVYSDADQRKHQSSASLAFVWGIHRDRWIPRTKGQLRGKCFPLMTSSCVISAGCP